MSKQNRSKSNKKKELLNEATVRRFAMLAGMKPLSEERLKEIGLEPVREEYPSPFSRGGVREEEEFEPEEGGEEMPPPTEEEPPMDAGPPEGGGDPEDLVQTLVSAIADAIEDAVGVEIEVEGGEEAPGYGEDEEEFPPAGEEEESYGEEGGEYEDEEIPMEEDGSQQADKKLTNSPRPHATEQAFNENQEEKVTDGGFDLGKDDASKHRGGVGKTEELPSKGKETVPNASPIQGSHLEEDKGADWEGESHELKSGKDKAPPGKGWGPKYESRQRVVARIARNVAKRLVAESRANKKKKSLKKRK